MSRININEIDNTITNYSNANLDNVVALVGNTTDGPYNTWRLITTYADFINIYGQSPESNNLIGNSWDYAVNLLLAKIPILFKRICPFDDMSAEAVDTLYFRGNNIIESYKGIDDNNNKDITTIENYYTAKTIASLTALLYSIDNKTIEDTTGSSDYDPRKSKSYTVELPENTEETYIKVVAKYPGANANSICILPYVNLASRVLYFNVARKVVSGNITSYDVLETIKIGSDPELVSVDKTTNIKSVNHEKAVELFKKNYKFTLLESKYVSVEVLAEKPATDISSVEYKIVNSRASKLYQQLSGGKNFLDYTTDNNAAINPDGQNDNDTAEYLQQYLPYITRNKFDGLTPEERIEFSKIFCYGKNGVVEYEGEQSGTQWTNNWMVLHTKSCGDTESTPNDAINEECLVMFADPSKYNVWYAVAKNNVFSDLKDKYKYHFDFVTSAGYTDVGGKDDIQFSLLSLVDDAQESEDGTFGRGDVIAIIDPSIECSQTEILSYFDADSINSSYAAAYAPWSKIMLPYQNEVKYMPPSYIFLYTYAKALYNGHSKWAAPAGITRASIPEIYNSIFEVGSEVLKEWQENNPISINPIININRYGYTIFGQKTLYNKVSADRKSKSALQELAVRMTANDIKKAIFYTSLELTFEYNNIYTWNEFKTRMAVTLDAMKNAGAIIGYQMILDDTTTTAQDIAENRIRGNIKVSMTRSVEDFDIDFEIMPSTVTFGE